MDQWGDAIAVRFIAGRFNSLPAGEKQVLAPIADLKVQSAEYTCRKQ